MPDAVTARALADLKMLFDYTLPWAQENNALEMLFLKGANANQEIMAARQHYNFSCKTLESCSDPQGQILHITSLKCGQTG
jgi:16S rRNA (guanine527-N7)-methyltransferase